MKLTFRPYRDDEDYWRLRAFLREVMLLNERQVRSWHVARLDYWWWFINPELEKMDLCESVFLWETESGALAAAVIPEGRGDAFLQLHPAFRTPELEEEMIALAEARLGKTLPDGKRKLTAWAFADDKLRQEILARRGYCRVERPGAQEVIHRRMLDAPLPDVPPTPGYTIRAMGAGLELLERAYASGLGFHNDDIQVARDNRDHPGWYHRIQSAPLYRRDLDIVATAADGSTAAFTTVWFDDVSRTAYFEPVATVPAHVRRGLAKAVIMEGLHRVKHMGCKAAFVGGYSTAANATYFSAFGTECSLFEPWEIEI